MPDFQMLEVILDESVIALKAGNLFRLGDLSDMADVAISGDGGIDRRSAERLHDKAQHNAALIAAAIKGVKVARQRAKELSAGGQFLTYDSKGQRNQVGLSSLPASRRF